MTNQETFDRIAEYTDLPLQQVDGVRRLDGPLGPPLHVEHELDAFGQEQTPLWEADGVLNSRPARVAHRGLRPAASAANHLNRQHRHLVKRAQRRLENAYEALSPFVRRKEGQKLWFAVRTALLLLGDVAGQAGAQIYFGEIPELALTQTRRLMNQAVAVRILIDDDEVPAAELERPVQLVHSVARPRFASVGIEEPPPNLRFNANEKPRSLSTAGLSVSGASTSGFRPGLNNALWVDPRRFELLTSSMRTRRATNCAKGPCAAEATQTRI